MRSSLKILFYLRKNYLNKEGKAGIMIRLTINGEMSQFSAKLDVEPELWNAKHGRVDGKTAHANRLNATLDNIKAALINHHNEIEKFDTIVTAEKVRNAFLGLESRQRTLLDLFNKHNEDVKKLVGVSKTTATLQKYQVTYKRMENFLKYKCNLSDISLKEINNSSPLLF
jgi:paraquat-inducible protein B